MPVSVRPAGRERTAITLTTFAPWVYSSPAFPIELGISRKGYVGCPKFLKSDS